MKFQLPEEEAEKKPHLSNTSLIERRRRGAGQFFRNNLRQIKKLAS